MDFEWIIYILQLIKHILQLPFIAYVEFCSPFCEIFPRAPLLTTI
jgi:hypothetical protein